MLHLQHAVLAWVRENAQLCDAIHGHEWGGMLMDLFTLVYFRRLQHGARSVVTPHGGHMWSMQWKPQRSFSVEPLRIDHQVWALSGVQRMTLSLLHSAADHTQQSTRPVMDARLTTGIRHVRSVENRPAVTGAVVMQERMVNLMADTMVSPTSYMRAYFRRRGWQLPADTRVIPNVMPSFKEQAAASHLQDVRLAPWGPAVAWHTPSQGIRVMWLAVKLQHELRCNNH